MWPVVLLLLSAADARLRSPQRELVRIERALSKASVDEIPELLLHRAGHELRLGDATGAVETCRQILSEYPGYARSDLVRFTLASTLSDLGETGAAHTEFKGLIRRHPDSPFSGDAWMILGLDFFNNSRLLKAQMAFRKVTRHPSTDRQLEAVYMLAWCHYNLGEIDTARTYLEELLLWSTAHPDHPSAQLRPVVLSEAVLFLADLEDLDAAEAFYVRHSAAESLPLALGQLADVYTEQGRHEIARDAYGRALVLEPDGRKALAWQVGIINSYWRLSEQDVMADAVLRLRTDYGPGSPWAAVNDDGGEVEQQLRLAAIRLHQFAQQQDSMELRKAACAVYTAWTETFSETEHAHEMRYAFGELLYKFRRFDEAFVQYQLAVDTDPNGPRARFCSQSSIFAALEMVKVEGEMARLSAWESRALQAMTRHLQLWPDDSDASKIAYQRAALLHGEGKYEQSEPEFRAIIAADPTTEEAEHAARLIIDGLIQREDWERLVAVSWELYMTPDLGAVDLKEALFDANEQASFQHALMLQPPEVIEALLDFTDRFPDSQYVALALSNAGSHAAQTDDVALALQCYEHLAQTFPRHDLAADALHAAGRLTHKQGDHAAAIAYYTRFLEGWSDDHRADVVALQRDRARSGLDLLEE